MSRLRFGPCRILVLAFAAALASGGCSGEPTRRVGDAYERNNMPSAAPDRPAGPHALNTGGTGDFESLRPSR
jgi:hypothetical protein